MTPRVIIQIEQADWEQLQREITTLRTLAEGKELEIRKLAGQCFDLVLRVLRRQRFERMSPTELANVLERNRDHWVNNFDIPGLDSGAVGTVAPPDKKTSLDCVGGEQCKVTTETIQP